MKKLLIVSALALSITTLAGCGNTEGDRFTNTTRHYTISTDLETGCKYISKGRQGGITPLLKADGTPDCGNK